MYITDTMDLKRGEKIDQDNLIATQTYTLLFKMSILKNILRFFDETVNKMISCF